ncbi:hypothetical protein ES708_30730 [subsurface metagenome]
MIFDEHENYLPDFPLEIDTKIQTNYRSYAEIIVKHCVKLQKGQTALITGLYGALPLIKDIYREILFVGGYPVRPLVDFPGRRLLLYRHASESQLAIVDPNVPYANEKIDVVISVFEMAIPGELAEIDQTILQNHGIVYSKVENFKDT